MDHIAGFDKLGLGEGVEDRGAGSAGVYQAGSAKHGQVLARVGEVATEFLGQVANRVLALTQDVKEHEPLGIGKDSADLRVEAIPLGISIAFIFHGCPLAISGGPAGHVRR
jgi:hypothetical protein